MPQKETGLMTLVNTSRRPFPTKVAMVRGLQFFPCDTKCNLPVTALTRQEKGTVTKWHYTRTGTVLCLLKVMLKLNEFKETDYNVR